MICSLNQIEQTARKAVRGAGLPWGVAFDASHAVRWLQARNLDAVSLLAKVLQHQHPHYAAENWAAITPRELRGTWRSENPLDPLLAGVSMSDCLGAAGATRIETATLMAPLLVAGFVGVAGETETRSVTATWQGAALRWVGGEAWYLGEPAAMTSLHSEFFCCQQHAASATQPRPTPKSVRLVRSAEVTVQPEAWAWLEGYARRTYVPQSAESRLRGAGAGLHDND